MNLIFSGLKTYFIRGRARPEVPPVESNSSSCISKDKNLVLQTDAITEMAQVICKWSETKSNNFEILEFWNYRPKWPSLCPLCRPTSAPKVAAPSFKSITMISWAEVIVTSGNSGTIPRKMLQSSTGPKAMLSRSQPRSTP